MANKKRDNTEYVIIVRYDMDIITITNQKGRSRQDNYGTMFRRGTCFTP